MAGVGAKGAARRAFRQRLFFLARGGGHVSTDTVAGHVLGLWRVGRGARRGPASSSSGLLPGRAAGRAGRAPHTGGSAPRPRATAHATTRATAHATA